MMPPTSDTPLIGIYFSLIMVMVACSVVCTVLILNYNKRTAECPAMPQWIELVFLYWLPWILRMDLLLHKSQSLSSFQSEMKMNKTMNKPSDIKSKRFSGVFSQMPQEYLGSLKWLNRPSNYFQVLFLAGNLANAHFPLSGDVNLCYSDLLYDGEESDISTSMPGLMSVTRSQHHYPGEQNEIERDLKVRHFHMKAT